MPDRRRAALVVLLVLVTLAVLLAAVPLELGAVRLAGVSLLWWYAAVAAPVVAVGVTVSALTGDRE